MRHPRNRTIAFEEKPERAQRIAANRLSLGALPVEIVEGPAPASFAGQPAPDAVFIGGGIGDEGCSRPPSRRSGEAADWSPMS